MNNNLKETIREQREKLTAILGEEMHGLAFKCMPLLDDHEALDLLLSRAFPRLPYCKHLYVLNSNGVQITANITQTGKESEHFERDRMDRPYMEGIIGITDFRLSDAYISKNKKRPSFTAIQVIRNKNGERAGFLGADFDLRELPDIKEIYQEPDAWRQVKGDPVIRSAVFNQQRIESQMDKHLNEVIPIICELISEHGVFHANLHFSSGLVTIWLTDDPFSYRILNFDDIIDPDICLAYPRRQYQGRAIVTVDKIMPIFEVFRDLRFADDNIYLRAGSINVINGMVSLNFSCDGSHYMRFDEFLKKNVDFWFGTK